MQNFYDILGVSVDATSDEIKSAFLSKIKQFHPDTFVGDKSEAEYNTKLITEAYNVLKNEASRNRYNERNHINTNSSVSKPISKENVSKEVPNTKSTKPIKKNQTQTSKKDRLGGKKSKVNIQEKHKVDSYDVIIFCLFCLMFILVYLFLSFKY